MMTDNTKNIIIIGAGDFGREIIWLIEDINKKKQTYNILGFLDDDEEKIGKEYCGYRCIGKIDSLIEHHQIKQINAVIAIQDSSAREKIVNSLSSFDCWETLIHPSANISGTSSIGKGCIVCAGSNISVDTKVGNHCLLNLSVTVGHDCSIGDYVSFMSGSCIGGRTTIGDKAYLATNCTVLPGKRVGKNATVGAGSVVIRNVQENKTVMGVPAKVLRI